MEIRPIPESPAEILVRFDTRVEYEQLYPHPIRLGIRNLLQRTGMVEPLAFPVADTFQLSAFRSHYNRLVDKYGFWEGDGIGSASGNSEILDGMRSLNRQTAMWLSVVDAAAHPGRDEDGRSAA